MNQLCINITINFNRKLIYINKHVHNSDCNALILKYKDNTYTLGVNIKIYKCMVQCGNSYFHKYFYNNSYNGNNFYQIVKKNKFKVVFFKKVNYIYISSCYLYFIYNKYCKINKILKKYSIEFISIHKKKLFNCRDLNKIYSFIYN